MLFHSRNHKRWALIKNTNSFHVPQSGTETHELTVFTHADNHIPSRNKASSLPEPHAAPTGCTLCNESPGTRWADWMSPERGSGSLHRIPSLKIRSLFLKPKQNRQTKPHKKVNVSDLKKRTFKIHGHLYIQNIQ